MRRFAVAVLAVASLVAVAVTSCKQGEGERCQRESDCSGGLVCNQATGLCQSSQSGADGNIQPDASIDGPDAPEVPDADIDAEPVDAEPDAETVAP
jgi:hypothetical protein